MQGSERDAATDTQLRHLEAGSRLLRMKTTRNLKEAHRLHEQRRTNPLERVYLHAGRRTHAPDHG